MGRAYRYMNKLNNLMDLAVGAINRNSDKPGLETMTAEQIAAKVEEEAGELIKALYHALSAPPGDLRDRLIEVEREAADLVVCCLAALLWARRDTKRATSDNYHLGSE